ncbi:uncharacterized protein LOC128852384 [Cuculus canorus]|uniref:uncharacterized protein LOC128852384 n=1 Tax=Cuculus canorus TaxID=55661 RepID=UPI0023AA5B64|nr:uncharacterized protein LOC128852384 [Cuculus canorus]
MSLSERAAPQGTPGAVVLSRQRRGARRELQAGGALCHEAVPGSAGRTGAPRALPGFRAERGLLAGGCCSLQAKKKGGRSRAEANALSGRSALRLRPELSAWPHSGAPCETPRGARTGSERLLHGAGLWLCSGRADGWFPAAPGRSLLLPAAAARPLRFRPGFLPCCPWPQSPGLLLLDSGLPWKTPVPSLRGRMVWECGGFWELESRQKMGMWSTR